ncbi:MAG: hypothetical protein ABI718_06070 [Acidobacteriota bacterium]
MDADEVQERAQKFVAAIAEGGPQAFFNELEELLPESWREHVVRFPLTAITLGLGVGLYLGMKRSEELLAAGASFASAAASANIAKVMGG